MNAKQIILKNKVLLRMATKVLRLYRKYPKFWKCDVVQKYVDTNEDIYFIQIGSNNGISGDPIYPYITQKNWHGVLVEPVEYIFNELVKNYEPYKDSLQFENSAIANKSGTMDFYRLNKCDDTVQGLPVWYDQLGSFKKEVVLKHKSLIPNFDELLVVDKVNVITFSQLLDKHSVQKVDLIHIDTEGYDYEILKMIPFDKISPDVIMFEHKHIKYSEYKSSIKLLTEHGYMIKAKNNSDSIAIKSDIIGRIAEGC